MSDTTLIIMIHPFNEKTAVKVTLKFIHYYFKRGHLHRKQ